jgi:hypothetical protein
LTDREFARSLLSSTSSLNDCGKELLSAEIEKYVNRINDWRLLFRATDARSGEESLFMKPYKTQFNDLGRIKQQWARYNQALDYVREEFDNAALVTLTSDPKKFPHLLAMADEITPNFNRLMSWMAYDCKERRNLAAGLPARVFANARIYRGRESAPTLTVLRPAGAQRPAVADRQRGTEREVGVFATRDGS